MRHHFDGKSLVYRISDQHYEKDFHNAWVTLFSNLGKKNDEHEDFDPLESLSASDDSEIHQDGAQKLEQSQLLQALESEIAKLPVRQREAFLMRYWDELSIMETAKAMNCSEGSVKTHCSRATQSPNH